MAAMSLQFGFGVIATTAVTADSALAQPKAEAVKEHEIRRKRPVASATDTDVRVILPFGVSKGTASSFSLSSSAGEIQSIIVPPGKKTQCPAGRILVSDDTARAGDGERREAAGKNRVVQQRLLGDGPPVARTVLPEPSQSGANPRPRLCQAGPSLRD